MNKSAITVKPDKSSPMVFSQGFIQRKCACGKQTPGGEECSLCKLKRLRLQKRSINGGNGGLENLAAANEAVNSAWVPLDEATRSALEPYFGHDFSRVRIHTGMKSAESAKAENALAYTAGNDIVFGAGQYAPRSASGINLLAHELTHVVQQQKGRASAESSSAATEAFEQEADRFAGKATQAVNERLLAGMSRNATDNAFKSGFKEEEDTQASAEPPDPRFLYQNGTTTCTFPAGTPSTVINNNDCARPCTVRHEAVHSTDISPCCAKAGTAHAAAATPAAKTAVENQFFGWMSGNRSWFECRAYAESVRCADEMLAAKNCSGPPAAADAACCATLASYRADKETRRASNCAAAGALSACPFP